MAGKEKKVRVLIVDDSLFMRTLLTNILNEHPEIEVIGTAADGYDAIEKVNDLKPDVITLDIDMPRLDGLTTLGYIMSECPTPVVMLSAVIARNSELTMRALDYGAVDFIAKPDGAISINIRAIQNEIIQKVLTAAKVDLKKLPVIMAEKKKPPQAAPKKTIAKAAYPVVIIGASTGGPRALSYVFEHLPETSLNAAYVIIQHMPSGFTTQFAQRLNAVSAVKVVEARAGDLLEPGRGFLAPGGFHLVLEQTEEKIFLRFDDGPREHGVKPSVNVTLRSAASLNLPKLICVILTGMGSDGADGCKVVKASGASIIAQNQATSVVYGMPQAAAKTGCVDVVTSLDEIPFAINKLIN